MREYDKQQSVRSNGVRALIFPHLPFRYTSELLSRKDAENL